MESLLPRSEFQRHDISIYHWQDIRIRFRGPLGDTLWWCAGIVTAFGGLLGFKLG
jgi:hypothetical protein